MMRPAIERMQQPHVELYAEKKRLEAHAVQLERIVNEQEQLLADARSYLAHLRNKRGN